jgi:Phosphoribosyl transferase (PRTase)/PELOTA RNA binding domain
MTTLRAGGRHRREPSPRFGSYAPDEVTFLVKDLGDLRLEVPADEYELRVGQGQHYAELLPLEESRPSPEGVALFHRVLARSSRRLALAVGVAAENVLAGHARPPVLVSLAQTGTPIGILVRRWVGWRHRLALPHYAISIVRGRGVDTNALADIRARHPDAPVQFVDGWTGKGAIARELAPAVEELRRAPGPPAGGLAVLADPAGCAAVAGTREDLLVPNACLNATVSGLVSRTVVISQLIGPRDFHGAKFYPGLAGEDVSGLFLDAITDQFPAVRDQAAARPPERNGERPSSGGWRLAERLAAEYGLVDVNLVKAGVSETVRMLLYRMPWRVLARSATWSGDGGLDAVLLLARHLRVPVERRPDLGRYLAVGLMRPPGRG